MASQWVNERDYKFVLHEVFKIGDELLGEPTVERVRGGCTGNRSHLRTQNQMAKRRGNPNWGKPEPIGPVVPTVTSFEQIVREFKLSPDQYIRSTRLREWARRNKNSKYIPEALLEAWGFEIESAL
jgi:hypothetical protein